MKSLRLSSLATRAVAVALLGGLLAGCAPLILGGAAVGTLMATDRRTSGAQIDDEAIELRAAVRIREALGDQVHINVTSYNRQVLLTGEVPSEAARARAGQIAGNVDNVRGVVNELAALAPTTVAQRSADLLVTGKVRASFVDASDLQVNAFKVVTERGVVYLMGRVTPREAERATSIARTISGVQKVVRMFEPLDAEDLRQAPAAAPAATVAPAAPAQPAGGAVTTPIR
jgi:osmotically-inducible protein OsmY